VKILVTGCGGSAAQNFVAALRLVDPLRTFTIVGLDASPHRLAVADADARYLAPSTTDEPAAWLDLVAHLARDCDLIHPQPDGDVALLTAHAERFAGKLALPPRDVVALCQDKMDTAEVLAKAGVPVPESASAHRLEDFLDRYGGGQVWLRAIRGAGTLGALRPASRLEAARWISQCVDTRGIPVDGWMVAEYLPGREYACQQLWWHGQLVGTFLRERLECLFGFLSPTGRSSTPALARTLPADHPAEYTALEAVRAVAGPTPHGVFGVDLREDAAGLAKVTEINAGRFFTTSLFSAQAGVNLPAAYVRCHAGAAVAALPAAPPDLFWVRVPDRPPLLLHSSQLTGGERFRTVRVEHETATP